MDGSYAHWSVCRAPSGHLYGYVIMAKGETKDMEGSCAGGHERKGKR